MILIQAAERRQHCLNCGARCEEPLGKHPIPRGDKRRLTSRNDRVKGRCGGLFSYRPLMQDGRSDIGLAKLTKEDSPLTDSLG